MGQVSSHIGSGASVAIRDKERFAIRTIAIYKEQELTCQLVIDSDGTIRLAKVGPAESISFHTEVLEDGSGIALVFALPESDFPEEDLEVAFELVLHAGGSTQTFRPIKALTAVNTSNKQELESILTKDSTLKENLRRHDDTILTEESNQKEVDGQDLTFVWRWVPPDTVLASRKGCINLLSFVCHDTVGNQYEVLAQLRFWLPPSATERVADPRMTQLPSKTNVVDESALRPQDSPLSPARGPFPWHTDSPLRSGSENPAEGNTVRAQPSQTHRDNDQSTSANALDEASIVDGPLFRATVGYLEKKTTSFRRDVKNVLKAALAAQTAGMKSIECDEAFKKCLYDMAQAPLNSLKPVMDLYLNESLSGAQRVRTNLLKDMDRSLIKPLQQLYEDQLKSFELRKRKFERESQEYYQSTSRYLGKSNEPTKDKAAEKKYRERKVHWDLTRFDYLSFLRDMNGGRREQVLISALSRYAITQYHAYTGALASLQEAGKNVESLHYAMDGAERVCEMSRQQQEEQRRHVEIAAAKEMERLSENDLKDPRSANGIHKSSLRDSDATVSVLPSDSTLSVNGEDRSRQIWSNSSTLRDLETDLVLGKLSSSDLKTEGAQISTETAKIPTVIGLAGPTDSTSRTASWTTDADDLRKEGFLWAVSRPHHETSIKLEQAPVARLKWHKVWTVCAGGMLTEYSNWKTSVEVKGLPADLKLAKARVTSNIDRRFCFEVVTPSYRRIYQATSSEDMHSWIDCITKASEWYLCQPKKNRESINSDSGRIINKTGLNRLKAPGITQMFSYWNSNLLHRSSHRKKPGSVEVAKKDTREGCLPRSDYTSAHDLRVERGTDKVKMDDLAIVKGVTSQDRSPSSSLENILALKAFPNNTFCADCQIANPKWVVWNQGLFVCINCAGRHRSLGTHISKVKSLELDTFRPEEVEKMVTANSMWRTKLESVP